MEQAGPNRSRSVRVGRHAVRLACVWTLIVGVLLAWALAKHRTHALNEARLRARMAHEKDMIYRQWNATHGGVYVPVTETTRPNPALTGPERDITTPSGRRLTLMNPAYMTRQVHEAFQKQSDIRGHITSLKPLRPANAPDAWEASALEAFERGRTEVSSTEDIDDEPHMRLMRPLVTTESCLKCHAAQGYRVGDVHGGISVAIPMAPLWAAARSKGFTSAGSYGLLWLVGLGGIYLTARTLRKQVSAEQALHETNARYRALVERLPIGMWRKRPGIDGELLMANSALARIAGVGSPDELLGRDMRWAFRDPRDAEAVAEKLARLGQVRDERLDLQRADGTPFVASATAQVVRDREGNPRYVEGLFQDITERVAMQEDLAGSRRQLAGILDSSPDGIVALRSIRDDAGRITDFEVALANPAAHRLLGMPGDTLSGAPLRETGLWLCADRLLAKLATVVERDEPLDCRHHCPDDGEGTWYRVAAVRLGDGVAVTFSDVTAQRQYEHQLRTSLEQVERANHQAVGRELRMIELKSEVNEIARKAGIAPPYDLSFRGSGNPREVRQAST